MLKIFIRHKWDGKEQVLKDLFQQGKIAIRYDNIRSINPNDYKQVKSKSSLKLLKKCCKEGAFVGAVYRKYKPSSMLVGKIKPGSKIKAELYDNGDMILKTVKLFSHREASPIILLANQPRFSTICKWHTVEKQLEDIVNGKKISFDVHSLHPSQLEVICYEYLRKKGILKALLIPIGRTLRDVDIYGIDSKGGEVMAQVTFNDNKGYKMRQLQKYAHKNIYLYFFGPDSEINRKINGIKYITVEKVFAELKKNPVHHQMIKKMLSSQ